MSHYDYHPSLPNITSLYPQQETQGPVLPPLHAPVAPQNQHLPHYPPATGTRQQNSKLNGPNGLGQQLHLPNILPSVFAAPQERQTNGEQYGGPLPQPTSYSLEARNGGEPRLMPVVGSQGRRGILPSAPGRAPSVGSALDGSRSTNMTPAKNSENKYPCNFCDKTYLHLKHLKRHHLRHTGERPYQCCLCSETFCRSDILKRHFNKCSIRRGNPTGANHLTHAQAHLTKNGQNSTGSPSVNTSGPPNSGTMNALPTFRASWPTTSTGFTNLGYDQHQHALQLQQPTESTRSSRSSSMKRLSSSGSDDHKRYSDPNNLAPINMTMNTSPTTYSTTNEDQRPSIPSFNQNQRYSAPQYQRDPYQRTGQSSAYYMTGNTLPVTSAPPMSFTSQAESQHSAPYYRGGIPYQNTPINPPHQQPGHYGWANCFQPGAQDSMMFPQ